MDFRLLTAALLATATLGSCGSGGNADRSVVREVQGGVNPYLWRATLDTLESLPLAEQPDPVGGVILYDWKSYEDAPEERIKATVYILDTRLRADGVKVSVFRQVQRDGTWQDAPTDPATATQLENRILERARRLKAAEIS